MSFSPETHEGFADGVALINLSINGSLEEMRDFINEMARDSLRASFALASVAGLAGDFLKLLEDEWPGYTAGEILAHLGTFNRECEADG